MNKKKAIVIGAGPAGLTAAYLLAKEKSIHPIVLESSSEIGGISKTHEHHGNRMDIGGHRFFSKNDDVVALWNEIMPLQGVKSKDDIILNRDIPLVKDGPDPEKVDNVMLIRHRVSRILYLHKFFDYPISIKYRTFANMGFARTMKAGFGYLGSCFHKRKETSLENFYINRFGKPLYRMFFEKYTEKVWGRHPSNISASWGAQRVKGLSLWKSLGNAIAKPFRKKDSKKIETSLIEQFSYPKKGPGQLYEIMRDKIVEMGGEVLMNSEVTQIVFKDKNHIDYLKTSDGRIFQGDYYISSMPLKDLAIAVGKENMDQKAYDIAVGLSYRDFMTVGLLVDHLSIKNETKIKTINNIVPDTWIYVQEEQVKLGRLQIFNNWSPYMVKDFDKYIWIGLEYFVNEGDKMWTSNDKDFIAMAIDELIKIKVIDDKTSVLDACLVRAKKAYPGYFDTYDQIDYLISYINSIDNLFCVGRNGQHRYNNMDHSMLTSMMCVDYILSPEGKNKQDIWNVNVEKEYHEKK